MFTRLLMTVLLSLVSSGLLAAPIDLWQQQGWTQFADDDGVYSRGYVDPGWGGQDFDAEYLYYKLDGNVLSLGLQTGFDINDNKVRHRGYNYFGGDLALSFDGSADSYEYAVDFGLFTRDYFDLGNDKVEADSNNDGRDAAGLYSVTEWNNDIYYSAESSPFAMDSGSQVDSLLTNTSGLVGDSYFRAVSFDLAALNLGSEFVLDAHWTMSCGNDAIDGQVAVATVPEPATLPLMALGFLGLIVLRRRTRS